MLQERQLANNIRTKNIPYNRDDIVVQFGRTKKRSNRTLLKSWVQIPPILSLIIFAN